MARIPRMELVTDDKVAVYHCVNRCLRGAYIGGTDKAGGKSYENRRRWLISQLEAVSKQLCIDLLAFAVEPQQLQLLIRTRPDLAKGLSDVEVARRYLSAIPSKAGFDLEPAAPTPGAIKEIAKDRTLLARARGRLSSLSWFVSQISEPVARNSNREDEVRGRFWEGRYHCLPILDAPALAAGVAHVDLAPILSGEATSLSGCKYTSAHVRSSAAKSKKPTWLSPLVVAASRKAAKPSAGVPFGLPISEANYLEVLEWTAKQVRRAEPGRFPDDLAEAFVELSVAPDSWLTLVKDYQKIFRRAAGTPESLLKQTKKSGLKQIQGITSSRELFS